MLAALIATLITGSTATPLARQSLGLVENCYHDFAITFDDGSVGSEYDIVDLFTENDSQATMFLNGYNYNCIYDQDSVERIRNTYNSGMQIGSHTWSVSLGVLIYLTNVSADTNSSTAISTCSVKRRLMSR